MKYRLPCPSILRKSGAATLRFACLTGMLWVAACSNEPPKETPKQALSTRPPYNYPINNPFAATIITVPPEMKVDYSSVPKPDDKTITLYRGRKIPEGFWYQDGLKYGELLQSKPAPLVYVIAGTGADSKAEDMITLADILYSGGFSVVLLPSPTHPNFIINASYDYTPGNPYQDSEDLYRLMQRIDERVKKETTVTGRLLTGYSLGAWDAAFTAKLDDERHKLGFSRVLLINPPLSLYSSMKVLDDYLYRALPHGINSADSFIKQFVSRLTNVSQNSDALDFSNERLLIDAYDKYQPSDAKLATLIGISFRLSAADMITTSDIMSHGGYIFPRNQEFTISTHVTPYMSVALRTSFRDYMNEVYFPKLLAQHPKSTQDDLIAESSLESLSGYISGNNKLRLITNKDDVILAPGEADKLGALFGKNAVIYPNGGHIGNLGHPAVAYQIIQFLRN